MKHLSLEEKKAFVMELADFLGEHLGDDIEDIVYIIFEDFYVEDLVPLWGCTAEEFERDEHFFSDEPDNTLREACPEYFARKQKGDEPEVYLRAGRLTHALWNYEAYGENEALYDEFHRLLARFNLYVEDGMDEMGRVLWLAVCEPETLSEGEY